MVSKKFQMRMNRDGKWVTQSVSGISKKTLNEFAKKKPTKFRWK